VFSDAHNRRCRERGFPGIASFPGCLSMNAIARRKPPLPHARLFATWETRLILNGWTPNRVRSLTYPAYFHSVLTLRDKDKYKTLCTIKADVSNVPVPPLKRSSVHFTQAESTRPFYRQKFWVVLSFGMTEMKAEVKWFEGVRTSRSFGFITLAHRHPD
jgi:hypothetical protein